MTRDAPRCPRGGGTLSNAARRYWLRSEVPREGSYIWSTRTASPVSAQTHTDSTRSVCFAWLVALAWQYRPRTCPRSSLCCKRILCAQVCSYEFVDPCRKAGVHWKAGGFLLRSGRSTFTFVVQTRSILDAVHSEHSAAQLSLLDEICFGFDQQSRR